jgi:hypothetical protein
MISDIERECYIALFAGCIRRNSECCAPEVALDGFPTCCSNNVTRLNKDEEMSVNVVRAVVLDTSKVGLLLS